MISRCMSSWSDSQPFAISSPMSANAGGDWSAVIAPTPHPPGAPCRVKVEPRQFCLFSHNSSTLPARVFFVFNFHGRTASQSPSHNITVCKADVQIFGRNPVNLSTAATNWKKSSRCLTSSDAPKSFTRFTATPPSFAPEQSTQVKAHTAESSPKTYTTAFR